MVPVDVDGQICHFCSQGFVTRNKLRVDAWWGVTLEDLKCLVLTQFLPHLLTGQSNISEVLVFFKTSKCIHSILSEVAVRNSDSVRIS